MIPFPHIAQRLFNTPLAITPRKAEMVVAALADRLGVGSFARAGGQAVDPDEAEWKDDGPSSRARRAYDIIMGVAVIPVIGTLVNRLGCLRPYSGMTGYDGIRHNLMQALEDSQVRAVLLDIDSPGGEVAGCFDLADTIYAARGIKPIWAVLNDGAYSAAYAVASACDRITVPRTGGTGSVGVVCMHVDFSKALQQAGIAITLIQFGDRKADGNEYQPLTDPALARFQADVNTMGEIFVSTVARNRRLDRTAVRATQARTFLGADGVRAGLADAVMPPDRAFRSLLAQLGPPERAVRIRPPHRTVAVSKR